MATEDIILIEADEIRASIDIPDALAAVGAAYAQLARGEVELPGVIGLRIPETDAELHAKGAYIHGSPFFSIKMSGAFPHNLQFGRPALSGSVFVFDASTGSLVAILRDHGYLTELRTAAAGALAAQLLSREDSAKIAVIGNSTQARMQVAALLQVRKGKRIAIYGRTAHKTSLCATEMEGAHGIPVRIAPSVQSAIEDADIIITATAAREPLVRAEWVRPGTHITAIGSDLPGKQELDPHILARAKVVVDRYDQCATQGELQHALAAGLIKPGAVHGEIGELVIGRKCGRTSPDEITVADFTGVGALDAAMANLFLSRRASPRP